MNKPEGYDAWSATWGDKLHLLACGVLEAIGLTRDTCAEDEWNAAVAGVVERNVPLVPKEYRRWMAYAYILANGQEVADRLVLEGSLLPVDGGRYVRVHRDES